MTSFELDSLLEARCRVARTASRKTKGRAVAAIISLALVTAACSSGDGESGSPAPDVPTASTADTLEPPDTDPAVDTTIAPTTSTTEAATTEATTTARATTTTTVVPRVYDFAEVSAIVETFVAEQGLNGAGLVIVERDDGVVYEEYWGEFDAERVSLVASSAKSVSAGVLMRLDDLGILDVDAPVADIADWGAGNPDITPVQLLTNSSGLPGILPNPAYAPYVCQFSTDTSLQECAAQVFTTPDDDGDVVAPDTEFRYGGVQWQTAGAAAEAASGKTWAELVDETYVEPCALDPGSFGYSNGFLGFSYPTDFDGDPTTLAVTDNPSIEGGLYSTAPAYAEFLLMNLRGGVCGDGERVLSQEALDRMHADRIGDVYGGTTPFGKGYGGGLGWAIDRDNGRIFDPGSFGSVPWLDPAEGYGGYLVVEDRAVTGQALFFSIWDLVDAVVLAAR